MHPKNRLLVGPLSQADENIFNFCTNLFLSALINDSIEKWIEAETEYEQLSLDETDEKLVSKKMEVDACAATVRVATTFFGRDEDYVQ